ncbi:MAG: hypothetical protein ABSD08_09530 [Xanthobacteraceae bacterium]|jgi:hypothetical protein
MYITPDQVRSPIGRWQLEEVLQDRGPANCAYAMGRWDGKPCIAFRWNGNDDSPGTPQSRGQPTWMILDHELYPAILEWLPLERRPSLRRFLGLGLRFDGTTLSEDQSRLGLWDISRRPPIIAEVACTDLKEALGLPSITPENCRLLADRNRDLLTEVADALFFDQQRYTTGSNGVTKVVKIGTAELAPVAKQFSTTVLDIVPRWG